MVPRKLSCPLGDPFLPPSLFLGNHWLALCHFLNYPKLSRISYKWKSVQYVLLFVWFLSLSLMILIFIHAVVSIDSMFYLIAEQFQCMDIPQFAYPFHLVWTLDFLALNYYK